MAQSEKIIISVELKDKGVKSGLQQTTSQVQQTTDATQKLVNAEKDEAFWASEAGRAEAERSVRTNIAKSEAKALALQTVKLTQATKEGKTQTGLNNAILVEAGRAASDAQFGMMGMANNIGQLATLMGQHAQTQGGFVASFKELGKSLMGTGGILIAIQLFISFLPKIEKWYKRVVSAGDEFIESLTAQQSLLVEVSKKLLDENITLEERKAILQSLKKDNKELFDLLVEDGVERKDANERFKGYLKLLKNEELIRKNIEKINTEISETSDDINEQQKIAENAAKNILFFEKKREEGSRGAGKAIGQNLTTQKEALEKINKLEEKKIGFANDVLELQKQNAKIRREIGLDPLAPTPRPIVTPLDVKMIGASAVAVDDLNAGVLNLNETIDKSPFTKLIDFHEKMVGFQEKAVAVGELASGFIDSEISREEAKTTKLNNELRDRMRNENLSAEERKNIQAKIAKNDLILAKKKDKLAEKQFKIDKALRISAALIDTYAATLKAYGSQLVVGDPTSIVRAKIVGGITAAFGLAKVAAIARTKFVPSATSAPPIGSDGGGGGGAAPQAPAFNIVGSSNVNQLSDAIAGQGDRPVRTYVVASDVSTAQELDRNIIESASL
jgi:hypothetical protein